MKRYFFIIPLLILVLDSFAQSGNVWSSTDDFSAGQQERGVGFSIRGRGYVCTGLDTADMVRNDLWEYDPASASWTQKANLPGLPRRNAVAFTIGDNGYVGTGVSHAEAPLGTVLKDFWKYDPFTNSWTAIADYPGSNGIGVYAATAFSIDNKGYVCAGKSGNNDLSTDLYEYKPLIDQWAQRASFPGTERYQMTSVVGGNKVYIGLGTDPNTHKEDWWEYHPGTNVWTQKGNFPASLRAGTCTFTIDNRPYVCMGTDGGYKDDLWEYVPTSDTWISRANFPSSGRKYAVSFVINNRAYVGLGEASSGTKRSFYTYVPFQP